MAESKFKTYVLIESMNNTVPIFQRVNKDQRVPIVKRATYAPYLQLIMQDKDGISKHVRYKEGCKTFDFDEQVEKYKIPANAKYTQSEYKDRQFIDGVLVTNKKTLQDWLEMIPSFDGSENTSDEIQVAYTIYDKSNENKIQNAATRKRAKAVDKVLNLDLEAAHALIIRLNGSFFVPPDDLDECQNMLVEFVDAAEDKGLDAVLVTDAELTIDEKTTILIGSAINAGILSFDKVEGKISKKGKDGKFAPVRDMSSEYTLDERKRLFSDFLNTDDGKALKDDIEKDLKKVKK